MGKDKALASLRVQGSGVEGEQDVRMINCVEVGPRLWAALPLGVWDDTEGGLKGAREAMADGV